VSCAICQIRKEKRFCPAVHGRICAFCCGTEREVTLDCPSDCVYLQQARQHERPRKLENLDQPALFPRVEMRDQVLYERESLLAGLTFGIVKAARSDRLLRDRDAIAALADLATSYERIVNSGLHYEPANANPVQQALAAELRRMIAEYRELEAKHLGYSSLRDGEVLQVVVFLLRTALAQTSGRPKSRAFIDAMMARFPEKTGIVSPEESGSRIVVP
jgi:hypothetical protein